MKESAAAEGVTVRNHHQGRTLSNQFLTRLAETGAAVMKIVAERYLDRVKLPHSVSVALVDDEAIARVHGEFMGESSPTDVITFPYGDDGEILISIDTAERQASEYDVSVERELALYLIHGVLHLAGYEDGSAPGRRRMEELQDELLTEVFGSV